MKWMRSLGSVLLMGVASLSLSGCLKTVLLNGQIKSTREGSSAVNTLHDYEVARAVAFAGIAQIEGMHQLGPNNTDALFMLTRSWGGIAFGFIEDDYERAVEAGDEVMIAYHQQRLRSAFERAKFYGNELLGHTAEGFKEATKNTETLKAWLKENFTEPEQAEDLLWAGFAWVGFVNSSKEDPAAVAQLYIGVALVERSVELDETAVYATGHTILGAYHARTAGAELEESKQHFDKALAINGGGYLSTRLNLARLYCVKSDKANWEKTLREVLAAGDPIPQARLQNVIAMRRAQRYLGNKIWQEDCGFNG